MGAQRKWHGGASSLRPCTLADQTPSNMYSSDLSQDFLVLLSRVDGESGLWPIQRPASPTHHAFDTSKQLGRSCHGPTRRNPGSGQTVRYSIGSAGTAETSTRGEPSVWGEPRAWRRDPDLRGRLAYIRTSWRRCHPDFLDKIQQLLTERCAHASFAKIPLT